MADLRNPTFEWRTHRGDVVKLDYVFCTRQYHVWVQPKGDAQAFWIGQTSDPKGAEKLIESCLSTWTQTTVAQIRGAINAIRVNGAVA